MSAPAKAKPVWRVTGHCTGEPVVTKSAPKQEVLPPASGWYRQVYNERYGTY